MKIMLIFLVASNRRVVPLNLIQTHHYLNHLYPLHHPHNCYKKRHLKKTTKNEGSKTLKVPRKLKTKKMKVPRKLKTVIYENISSILGL